jgi:hypothetical protein
LRHYVRVDLDDQSLTWLTTYSPICAPTPGKIERAERRLSQAADVIALDFAEFRRRRHVAAVTADA